MASLIIPQDYLDGFGVVDAEMRVLHERKIRLFFELLGIQPSASDWECIKVWSCIVVTVPDRKMAGQLNNLMFNVPGIRFILRIDYPVFTLLPGDKKGKLLI